MKLLGTNIFAFGVLGIITLTLGTLLHLPVASDMGILMLLILSAMVLFYGKKIRGHVEAEV